MATLKQRLHKRNSSGSYDTVYLETNTDMVLLTDGSTTLTSKLSTMDSNISGKAASGHKHAAGDITSGTLSSSRLPTVPVNKGGTGKTSLTSGRYLVGNDTGALIEKTPAEVLANIGAAAASHKHAATDITSGTLDAARIPTLAASKINAGTFAATGVKAATGTDYTTARVRNIKASTTDLTAGSSSLSNGDIYLVYE